MNTTAALEAVNVSYGEVSSCVDLTMRCIEIFSDRNSVGWFAVGLGSWCRESAIDVLSIRVSPTGSFGNLELFLDKSNDAALAPWAQLDDILADLGAETPGVAIHQHRHGSKSLFLADVKCIQERMPRLSQIGKIQFYVCREESGEYVEVDSDALQDKLELVGYVLYSTQLGRHSSKQTTGETIQ